jgi:hypothetical protein
MQEEKCQMDARLNSHRIGQQEPHLKQHPVLQHVKDTHTSTLIPVWVSATSEPDCEVLVYALLDTQSDTTFLLDDTAKALHAKNEPVQLKALNNGFKKHCCVLYETDWSASKRNVL